MEAESSEIDQHSLTWSRAKSTISDGDRSVTAHGDGFQGGFIRFFESSEFSDVIIVVDDNEWHLHSIILAGQSEFFHKALTSNFAEKRERRINLACQGAHAAWPQLVQYFYTDSVQITRENVLPLMALARQLMVAAIDSACIEFITSSLSFSTCLSYLKEAVRYNLHDLQKDCTAMAAKGMYFLYNETLLFEVAGLPPQTVVEILQHEALMVHCELQVVQFVLKYLAITNVDEKSMKDICAQIRFPYLDNDTLTMLAAQGILPRDAVVEGVLARMALVDKKGIDFTSLSTPPRPSYCCNIKYNLPGGSTFMDVELESIWDQLVQVMTVRVSSVGEGSPLNILGSSDHGGSPWFETQCSPNSPPWVEVTMPSNVKVVALSRYTYAHGHHRTGYYRMRNFKTQMAEIPGATWVDLPARNILEQNEVQLTASAPAHAAMWALGAGAAAGPAHKPFQVLRILSTGAHEDGVSRLCIRDLKMFGVARVDVMAQSPGSSLVLQPGCFVPAASSGVIQRRRSASISRAGSGSSGGGAGSSEALGAGVPDPAAAAAAAELPAGQAGGGQRAEEAGARVDGVVAAAPGELPAVAAAAAAWPPAANHPPAAGRQQARGAAGPGPGRQEVPLYGPGFHRGSIPPP